MARRKIAEFSNGNRMTKVYRDSQWDEYRVTLYVDNAKVDGADSHTDDKADAMATAKAMIGLGQHGSQTVAQYATADAENPLGINVDLTV
jgi:hypothetical protein